MPPGSAVSVPPALPSALPSAVTAISRPGRPESQVPPARSPQVLLELPLPVPSTLVLPPVSSAPVCMRWSASLVLVWKSMPLVLVVVVLAVVGNAPAPLLLRPPPLGHQLR